MPKLSITSFDVPTIWTGLGIWDACEWNGSSIPAPRQNLLKRLLSWLKKPVSLEQEHLDTADAVGRSFIEKLRPHPCYGGMDLAAINDLTAFVLAWPIKDDVYLYPWFWLPEDDLAGRSKHDNVRYDLWAEQGFLELTPGAVTDWRFVTARIKQLARIFKIRQIGFDRYGARDTVADLMEVGIEVVDTGQGFVSMNAPCRRMEELVLSKHLVHTGHPVLRWNADCTTTAQDPAGNIKLVKPNRQSGSKRIDGMVASVMAIDCIMKNTKKSMTPGCIAL
jgi:phage terminase large subunit-like protein